MSEKVYVNICDKRKCPGPVYAVKKGDTLYSIAQKYHCRVRTLLDLNPFVDIYNLQPGEEICVPDCRGQGKVDFRPYVVKEGDTLGGILKNVSMSFEELAKVIRSQSGEKSTSVLQAIICISRYIKMVQNARKHAFSGIFSLNIF